MRKAMLGLAALIALVATAEARDGCGRGYYFNGYACVPQPYAPPPPAYAPPPPPPGYGYGYGYGYGRPAYRPPAAYAPAVVDKHGQQLYYPGPRGSCPSGYTVQAGFCRPYRGY